MPVSAKGETRVYRKLVPFVDDENPHHFQRRPNSDLRYPLNAGNTKLSISVIDVGNKIIGEQVFLTIEPPITFKIVYKNYEFFWWFVFWPIYVFLLVYIGIVLLRVSIPRPQGFS